MQGVDIMFSQPGIRRASDHLLKLIDEEVLKLPTEL